jgi:hypothetical protein
LRFLRQTYAAVAKQTLNNIIALSVAFVKGAKKKNRVFAVLKTYQTLIRFPALLEIEIEPIFLRR